ncbi:antitoxin Xre/MbcA/ParS toxin-binding domain-containing protein [Lacibacterium aquatile]|uniref:Antitoxin Xre/MbcA/ParS toxin-binding domain-containing protein n=1 Tax=Lacibacterium aquatile TaxID=1168082 RepID=A0ABW5DTM8_9PROT
MSLAAKRKDVASLARSFTGWIDRSREKQADAPALFVASEGEIPTLAPASAATIVRDGLSAGHVAELLEVLGIERKDQLSRMLNTNGTSLWRWEKQGKPLPSASVEQLLRTMQLQLIAADVFGAIETGREWLRRPHPLLDGLPPADYADNEFGAEAVRGMLVSLKYGGVA